MKKYKLGEIAEIEISGVDKKTKEGEIPVKLCNFVDVYHNWAITKDLYDEFMDASARQSEIDIYKLKKGQVAFTKDSETRDDIGIPTYIADNFDDVILGYHTALVTPNREFLNGKYLNAFMNSRYIQKYFEFNASGSGQRYTLSNDTLNNIPILAPDLNTQSKIGELFSSLDKKIALNSRINARLEQMAKRLYEHYFVQFDFPTADGKPYKTSGGKMVYSSELKREIPEGWEVKRLGDILENNIEVTDAGEHLKGLKYCPIDEIPMKTMSFANGKPYTEANSSLQLYKRKDILIGAMRVYFHRCCIASEPGITRTTTIVLSPKNKNFLSYVYQVCNEDKTFDYAIKVSNGTQQPYVTWKSLKEYQFVYPKDEKIIEDFCKNTNSIIDRILENVQESARLTSLRDRLLPLLMNGQVSV